MAPEKTERNSSGLREMLFEQIDGVRNGSIDPKKAKTIASLAMTIIKSVEVEMQFREQQASLKKMGEPTGLGALPLAEETGSEEEEREPQPERPRVTSPIVPKGARVVTGRAY
jgi:hypothetical protein